MARQARIFSATGLYHIMFRGTNKQEIFNHPNDYEKMKDIILNAKEKTKIEIYAYCMMPNHMHMIVREVEIGDISIFMKRILSHYAGWYNFKYQRVGHLFANRYKSLPVEDEGYLFALIKYIHNNPVVAGFTDNDNRYRYSSYSDYINDTTDFTDVDFLLNVLDDNRERAIAQFKLLHTVSDDESAQFDYENKYRDFLARIKIIQITGGIKPGEIRTLPKQERNELLIKLMKEHDFKKTTLANLTGLSRKTLTRLLD